MYSLEKDVRNFYEDHVTWKVIDVLMSWAAQNKEWYKMGHNEFKKAFHSHAKPINHIPKNASVNIGLKQVETAYFSYLLSPKRISIEEEKKYYITKSLKNAERIRDHIFFRQFFRYPKQKSYIYSKYINYVK